jgi:signal transduction histidine kinase
MKIISRTVEKIRRTSMWNLLWISLVLSEVLTFIMNTILGWLRWGKFSLDLILIGTIDAFFVAFIVTFIIILVFREYDKVEREAEENSRKVAVLQEREEVSRWLHDNVGSDLFNITLISEMIQRRQVQGDETDEYLERISAASRNALNTIRSYLNFSEQVGPAVKDLVGYMRDYGQSLFRDRGVAFDFRAEVAEETLPLLPMKSFSVYLIYKEAITNILKHARAKKVDVLLTEGAGRLLLTVSDDGRGFTAGEASGERYGTRNITRRAEMIGGEILFDSEPGQGTSVRLTVPV